MRRNDPRIRQTLDQISQTLESANLTTQASLFSFNQNYLTPCFSSVNTCLEASCYPCFHAREERRIRRNRLGRTTQRGRPELSFDFYDDWDDDENEGAGLLGGWGNDELDRLLAGSGAHGGSGDQPGRHRTMSYGTRRKGLALPKDGGADPTIVPNSSIFGFLDRLPWRFGGRGIRYKPSAADLQENLGRKHHENGLDEGQPLIEESDEEETVGKHRRKRSDTTTSGSTNNSLSSRGDLFPSEDEDDAIPLDDEFAMVLERRITGTASDDVGSGKKRGKRPSTSQTSTKTTSSRETTSTAKKKEGTPVISAKVTGVEQGAGDDLPSMTELKEEEERIRQEEEAGIERRRHAAKQLARQMGLSSDETQKSPTRGTESDTREMDEEASPTKTEDFTFESSLQSRNLQSAEAETEQIRDYRQRHEANLDPDPEADAPSSRPENNEP
ncbi:hypothetical protein MMC06_003116 [Schaereria dolodes]|nr:hypothetical protein [Schaereria dolodes]